MSAIVKPSNPYPHPPSRGLAIAHRPSVQQPSVSPFQVPVRSRHERLELVQSNAPAPIQRSRASVRSLPQVNQPPAWVKALITIQRGSTVLTFTLVAAVLAVYSWTVYTQHRWGEEYDRLEILQRDERQINAANEALKDNLARQAEIGEANLVLPQVNNILFLEPAPERPGNPVVPESAAPTNPPVPLGY